tara:strand:+ start:3382 stop:4422 length:1041 start_codon:yes stop_codon:yes gene_type:complete
MPLQSDDIFVNSKGAVMLGPDVVCDGFCYDAKFRVQTHVHSDHMVDFDRSKGRQSILLSFGTKELLIAKHNADLPYRDNILPKNYGEAHICQNLGKTTKIKLVSSNHMLGASQVEVELRDGRKVGYSGDFQWPSDEIIKVDILVVDATYGSPRSIRNFTQEEANGKLIELTTMLLGSGPVEITAFKGVLERVVQLVSSEMNTPLIANPAVCKQVKVYRDFGFPVRKIFSTTSDEGKRILREEKYIRFYQHPEGRADRDGRIPQITCSAFFTSSDDPVVEYTDTSYCVALSDHADFKGTLDYIQATGAKVVLTNNSKSGHGETLAHEIRSRLGLEAKASYVPIKRIW